MKTAEFVTPKHPDKMCDQISDAILDEALKQDPDSRVAIETMGGHGIITVTGEMTTKAYIDVRKIVTDFMGKEIGVQVNIVKQSPEIANGVDTGGAGDQGIMVGYAVNETENFMPLEYELARSLCRRIFEHYPYDGKTQITIDDDMGVTAIVASFQNVPSDKLRIEIINWINEEGVKVKMDCKMYPNPAGDWNQGGFDADTGLTGRKLMVDNYGPRFPIGGGAFSGKDSTKVDRSAAYMARHMAVYYLKHLGANQVVVKLAYAIGVAEPVMVVVEVNGKEIKINDGWDLTPKGIIKELGLKKPIFQKTAEWGHFGNKNIWN
jgi:S-adenosylmethionine synthetase